MQVIRRIDNVGTVTSANGLGREVLTLATATTARMFASNTTRTQETDRQAFSICYLSSTATDVLYVRVVPSNASAPTVSSTNADYVIAVNQTVPFQFGKGVAAYFRSSSAGNSTVVPMEMA